MRRLQKRWSVAALTARRRAGALAAAATAVVVADQVSKTWAEHTLADHPVHLVWTLRLVLSYNKGAAFSIGTGLTPLLMAAGVLVLVGLLVMTRSVRTMVAAVALGLVLGGAVGNLTDRFVRNNEGAVIDFVDLQWWPVFNLADAALVTGGALLVFDRNKDEA